MPCLQETHIRSKDTKTESEGIEKMYSIQTETENIEKKACVGLSSISGLVIFF